MRKMGFSERWIGLIMVCVRSVTYSILVNGEPKGMIQPSRGLRQGDPLSPFLFLLCTEGLHGLINKAANNDDIHGFSLCKRGPKLTHLFFLQMIAFSFVGPTLKNAVKFWSCYQCMKRSLAKNYTGRRQPYSSAKQLQKQTAKS